MFNEEQVCVNEERERKETKVRTKKCLTTNVTGRFGGVRLTR